MVTIESRVFTLFSIRLNGVSFRDHELGPCDILYVSGPGWYRISQFDSPTRNPLNVLVGSDPGYP